MTREEAEEELRQVGALADEAIDLAGTALVLASFERPRVDLARYRAHLDELAVQVTQSFLTAAPRGPAPPEAALAQRLAALNAVLFARYDYAGDELTYDDMQNANLMQRDRPAPRPAGGAVDPLHPRRARARAGPSRG